MIVTSSIVHSRYWSISSTNKVFILEMSLGLHPTLQKYSGERQVMIAVFVRHNPPHLGSFIGVVLSPVAPFLSLSVPAYSGLNRGDY